MYSIVDQQDMWFWICGNGSQHDWNRDSRVAYWSLEGLVTL